MPHLVYSNRTERLLEELGKAYAAFRDANRWAPFHVVVPNRAMERFVLKGLAQGPAGIAANVSTGFLDALWREPLLGGEARLLDRRALQAVLLSALQDNELLALETLAPVRHYLQGDGEGIRRVQLASKLSGFFDEYALSRPDWIAAWDRGKAAEPRLEGNQDEAWQRALWRHLRELLARSGSRWMTLAELLESPVWPTVARTLPRALHIFGLTYMAEAYHRAFTRMAQSGIELHVYTLNPCQEYWEDLPTHRAGPLQDSEDPFGFETLEDPLLLKRWGRPGRENIRLLNEGSDYAFHDEFQEPVRDTLLHSLQADIQTRAADGATLEPDDSLKILACPGLRREAECVASEIWELVARHRADARPLRFSEITVIVPPAEKERYFAHLKAAFAQGRDLPCVLSDEAGRAERSVLEAAELLLDLPLGGFTRTEILRVLGHPAVVGSAEAAVEAALWCERLGIVHGCDRSEFEGTYVEGDRLNWDQGLHRLALGAFMGEDAAWTFGDTRYYPERPGDSEDAGRFIGRVRPLLRAIQELRHRTLSLREGAETLADFLSRWLEIDPKERSRARAVQRVRQALLDLGTLQAAGLPPVELPYPALRALAREALEGLAGSSSPNGGGIVVSTYAPMRAIPARALFLMGLGEGSYPGRDERSPLDLRRHRRRGGDVSRTEQDAYLFLEMLLSAREHAVLSYVNRNDLTGDPKAPASLVNDVLEACQGYLPDPESLVASHPLRRYDPRYFAEPPDLACHLKGAQGEAEARVMGLSLGICEGATTFQNLAEIPLAPAVRAQVAHRISQESIAPPAQRATARVSLSQLKGWLKCPLQGAAKIRLGLRDEEEDLAFREEEAFATEALTKSALRTQALWESLRTQEPVEQVYGQFRDRLASRAEVPLGLFAEAEREQDLELLEHWRAMAPASANRQKFEGLEPFEIEGMQIELAGETTIGTAGSSLFPVEAMPLGRITNQLDDKTRKKALEAYVDQVALTAAGLWEGPWSAVFLAHSLNPTRKKNTSGRWQLVLPALAKEAARDQVRVWLSDLYGGVAPVQFPIEAVLAGQLEDLEEWLEGQWSQDHCSLSSQYGPVTCPQDYPVPADPVGLGLRRFGPFLEAIEKAERRLEPEAER